MYLNVCIAGKANCEVLDFCYILILKYYRTLHDYVTRRGGGLGPRLDNLPELVLYVHFLQCFSEWESALQRLRAISASPAPAGEILREVTSSSSCDSEDSDS